jgi:uncharacterized protein YjbJ (UPF0337 family)
VWIPSGFDDPTGFGSEEMENEDEIPQMFRPRPAGRAPAVDADAAGGEVDPGARRSPNSGGFMTDKNIDKGKGRVKEAAGALTGDRSLKNRGRVDQAKGSVKNAVDKIADRFTSRKNKK